MRSIDGGVGLQPFSLMKLELSDIAHDVSYQAFHGGGTKPFRLRPIWLQVAGVAEDLTHTVRLALLPTTSLGVLDVVGGFADHGGMWRHRFTASAELGGR